MTAIPTAIVAYGYAGRSLHAPLIALEPRLKVSAVVARDPARRELAAHELGAKTYASLDECLRADASIQLVVVATPHDSHASIAIDALNAGRHVVVDKPLCLSMSECDAMLDAARRANRVLTVYQNRRFDGDAFTLRRLLDAGELGELRWLELNWNRHGLSKKSAWRNDARLGGRPIDLGAHLFDRAVSIFDGDAVQDVVVRKQHDWPDAPVASSALVTIAFASGRTCVIDVGSMTRYPKPQIVAVGTRATFVKFGEDPQEAALLRGDLKSATHDPATFGTLYAESGPRAVETVPGDWTRFYVNVADAIEGKAPPIVRTDQMREVMKVIDAVMRA
jgi:scyllo-inositol 2-dehydrogenase (NADP+)